MAHDEWFPMSWKYDGDIKSPEKVFLMDESLDKLVVSIGVNSTFKVIFTPMEYIPTMSKRLHFFGPRFHYVINICLYFLRKKKGLQQINSAFPLHRAGLSIDVYWYKDDVKKKISMVLQNLEPKKWSYSVSMKQILMM